MTCDPRLLHPFVVLAEELHFGRAAERLALSQPALSQQIRRLELQLGVQLFARTRRRVELTDAGAAVLVPAQIAAEAASAASEMARGFARGDEGDLQLGLSPGAHEVSRVLLAEFARRRPNVRVRARQDSSGALAEQIAAGELEMGLGFCTDPPAGVRSERLLDEPAVVAVSADHPLADRGRLALSDLAGEVFALVDARDGPGYNRAVIARCREAGFEPRTKANPHGPMAWETAVRSGACVGLTTASAAVSTARGVRLLDVEPSVTFPLELLAPAGQEAGRRPAARAFVEMAREMARAGTLLPGSS